MNSIKLSGGVAHQIPRDLYDVISSDASLIERWEDLTPLARNEWICWTITVKQQKTRNEHVKRVTTELAVGKRRPCCWMGCIHRKDKKISPSQQWVLDKQSK